MLALPRHLDFGYVLVVRALVARATAENLLVSCMLSQYKALFRFRLENQAILAIPISNNRTSFVTLVKLPAVQILLDRERIL
jgi:hypothetical protein